MKRTTYTLPERAKSRRKELRLTLLQVANRVGVTEATVQRWESGEIKSLRYDNIIKLADALETSPAFLMGWDDHHIESTERKKLLDFIEQLPDDQVSTYRALLELPIERLRAVVDLLR